MAPWRLARSLEQLRSELNARWPNRDHSSDGAIGDTAHAHTASDHNPNSAGDVCAYDIDTDLDGTNDSNDPEMNALVEWLRLHPHPTLKYVIYRGRMFSSYERAPYAPFEWRPYTKDPHISHPHVSVGQGSDGHSAPGTYDDTTPWLTGFGQQEAPDLTPNESAALATIDQRTADQVAVNAKVLEVLGRLDLARALNDPAKFAAAVAKAIPVDAVTAEVVEQAVKDALREGTG